MADSTVHPAAAVVNPECAKLAKEFEDGVKSASGRCSKETDCDCYSSPVMDNLLYVSDRPSAAKLNELTAKSRVLFCPSICVQVAPPPVCKPRCIRQRCN